MKPIFVVVGAASPVGSRFVEYLADKYYDIATVRAVDVVPIPMWCERVFYAENLCLDVGKRRQAMRVCENADRLYVLWQMYDIFEEYDNLWEAANDAGVSRGCNVKYNDDLTYAQFDEINDVMLTDAMDNGCDPPLDIGFAAQQRRDGLIYLEMLVS